MSQQQQSVSLLPFPSFASSLGAMYLLSLILGSSSFPPTSGITSTVSVCLRRLKALLIQFKTHQHYDKASIQPVFRLDLRGQAHVDDRGSPAAHRPHRLISQNLKNQ